jgi:hypothetical protein
MYYESLNFKVNWSCSLYKSVSSYNINYYPYCVGGNIYGGVVEVI